MGKPRTGNGFAMLAMFYDMQEFKMITIMKDLLNDYKNEGFTLREWVIYGVICPLALIAVCLIGSYIDNIIF